MDFLPGKNKKDQSTKDDTVASIGDLSGTNSDSAVNDSKASPDIASQAPTAPSTGVTANVDSQVTEGLNIAETAPSEVPVDSVVNAEPANAPQAMTDTKTAADPNLADEIAKSAIPASEDEATEIEKEQIQKIQGGIGINLIPKMSQEEISSEKKKTGVNFVAAFFILFLALITILIVGFNIITKATLNRSKESLYAKENEVTEYDSVVNANNQILDRFNLYSTIEDSSHSPKEILLYIDDVTSKFGEVESVELSGGFRFVIKGYATDMTEISRLWHLLNVDDRIASIELDSVSKQTDKVTYTFDGELNMEYFINNQE